MSGGAEKGGAEMGDIETVRTEADFEDLSWHDCSLWRLEFRVGEPREDDWTTDLVLGIDYIVAWSCGEAGESAFQVAPAELAFHGVTEPRVALWTAGEELPTLHMPSIDGITRERVRDQKVFLDRPYWRWRVAMNWPKGGEIRFAAAGFTQRLLAEPLLVPRQHLTLSERSRARERSRT